MELTFAFDLCYRKRYVRLSVTNANCKKLFLRMMMGKESLCPEQDWPSDDDYDPEKVASHSSTDS
ncbi:hypothetical protein H5410_044394 [Solanum commersonii]|uniref:Uncharacterized protein n=1 Tax=Solanum commersonii TaxID=4109 RepID=A0A9J5XAR8_SOLCO|nr:hypothetical protein H5410_044394 [Solanum commersonii]